MARPVPRASWMSRPAPQACVGVETGAAGLSTGFASVTFGCGLGVDCDPGSNAKSSASDDENDGTCCPLVSRDTSMRVRLRTCSTVAPETFNSLISSDTNTAALPSLITVSDGADIITAAPLGAVIAASPAGRAAEIALIRIVPRRVDDGDFASGAFVGHIAEDLVEAEAIATNVALVPNLGVDRNEIALPAGLDSEIR